MSDQIEFRNARREDTPLILAFIRELADYEHMLDEVVADVYKRQRLYFALGLRCSLLVELRNLDGTKMLLSIWKSKKRSNKDTSKLEFV